MPLSRAPSLARLVVFLAALFPAAYATAQLVQPTPNGLYYGAVMSTSHDSNVTLQPAGPGAVGDTIDSYSLLGGYDRTFDREHVFINALVGRVLYNVDSFYDYTLQNFQAGLKSNLAGNINTEISAMRTTQLVSQAFLDTTRRDVIASNSIKARVDVPLAVDFRGVAEFDGVQVRNSDIIDVAGNLNSTEFLAGVRYQTGAQNYADLLLGSLQATFPEGAQSLYEITSYHDLSVDLRTLWRFSGFSQLEGRIGYLRQRDEVYSFRDFSGPAYELTYKWTPTAKALLTLYGLRSMGATGNSEYLSAVTHTYRVTPAYLPTEKIRFEVFYQWSRYNYFSDVQLLQLGQSPVITRNDTDNNYGLAAIWAPLRWLQVKLEAHREWRDSTVPTWDFVDRVTTLTLQARF